MTDQEQADVLLPGHPCIAPNAERLAAEGVSFSRAYCPSPHCCPSRATFMTGLYPSRHGIYNNVSNPTAIHRELNHGVSMFSEGLRDTGYRLAFAGKWHVSDAENPSDRGWEELEVTARAGSYMHRSLDDWRTQASDSEAETRAERRPGQIKRPGWGDYQLYETLDNAGPKGYENGRDYRVVKSALAAMEKLSAGDVPWCLYVGLSGPHDPFRVPARFVDMYDPGAIPLPASFGDTLEDKPRVYQRMRRQYWGQLSEAEVRESIRHYWAYCTMQDAMFGEVLSCLGASGQADDTVVVRLSDHGDYCGSHGLYLKGVPAFREAYHVPCIVRWPRGATRPGRAVDEFVSLADMAPTFLELAAAPVPDGVMSGRSLVPFLKDETPADWPDAVFAQLNGVELYYTQRSVTTTDHKYVYNGFDFDELYDLQRDPHEMVNLADDPKYAEVKRELVRRMWRFGAREDDIIFNPYATVALAPWGPADALVE